MKNKKSFAIITTLIIVATIIGAIFYLNAAKIPDDIPEGFSLFNNSSVPYRFYYPSNMNIAINDNNGSEPIITVTTSDDPKYYYAITGGETEEMNNHFAQVNTDILDELLTLTDGMIMETTDFFEINDKTMEINGTTSEVVEFISKDMELTPFSGSLYKIDSTEKNNYTYVVFVSWATESELDVVLNSLHLK